jgi:hypothetical protein
MPNVRGPSGRFIRGRETAERDAEACELRLRGLSYRAIAKQMGYADQMGAYEAVKRSLSAVIAEPAEQVRQQELERLNTMWEQALEIAKRFHVTVQQGRVVYANGEPVKDDAPALAAMNTLLKIQERRSRLLGLDAPVKHEVRNVDAVDAEIEQLVAQLGAGRQDAAPAEAAPGSTAE